MICITEKILLRKVNYFVQNDTLQDQMSELIPLCKNVHILSTIHQRKYLNWSSQTIHNDARVWSDI